MHDPKIDRLVRDDPRYPLEAYEFIFNALSHTQILLRAGRAVPRTRTDDEAHVTPRQLLEGIRDLALREFGMLATTVLRAWGVATTADFGEILFNLIDAGLMTRSPAESREDFRDGFDIDGLARGYRIEIPAGAEEKV